MNKKELQNAKGVRDLAPKEKMQQQAIVETIEELFESYGYSPLETPIIERYEVFASKFGPGDQSDAMKETFKLSDQGKRSLILRNEFTVPFARFVAMNPTIKMPFKRYQVGPIFRDGPIKRGRYRQFWQADIDVVGIDSLGIDAEMVQIAQQGFSWLGLDVEVLINSRKILNGLLELFGVAAKNQASTLIIIDKLDKIGANGVRNELDEKGIIIKDFDALISVLNTKGSNDEVLAALTGVLGDNEGVTELREVLKLLQSTDVVRIVPSLVRGQAYYTGIIYEVYLKDKTVLESSLASGGRYNDMIGGFLGRKEQVPAIGLSFGVDVIMDAMQQLGNASTIQTPTELYIALMNKDDLKVAMKIASVIRKQGINVEVDYEARKLKKAFEYADAKGIPFVGVLGEDEVAANGLTIKDMKKGEQTFVLLDDVAALIR